MWSIAGTGRTAVRGGKFVFYCVAGSGEKAPGDVANKKVPATRSSVGRPVVPKAREAARVPTPLEGPVSEGLHLKAPGQPRRGRR